MSITNDLDIAIMQYEAKKCPGIKAGYCVTENNGIKKVYPNYMENNVWTGFLSEMQKGVNATAYRRYKFGGGKELDERKSGTHVYPPKMASFGSSSRMIYNLMKNDPDFVFEKKLPTTIGGVANLDGFKEFKDKYVFIEAKCREPYSGCHGIIATVYADLLKEINNSKECNLYCSIEEITQKNKLKVEFSTDNTMIKHFDIKQMICHLLGIGTSYLNGKLKDRRIEFIYLLYDPCKLEFKNSESQKKLKVSIKRSAKNVMLSILKRYLRSFLTIYTTAGLRIIAEKIYR